MAALYGAKTAGIFRTTRSDPSSRISFVYAELKTDKNIRSNPTEVSMTKGT